MIRPTYHKTALSLIGIIVVYGGLLAILLHVEADEPTSNIKSFQYALWYLLATVTTVGYGDMIPISYWLGANDRFCIYYF